MTLAPLTADRLFRPTNLKALDFDTTRDLEDVETLVGQDRALEAVRFGARMRGRGYNLFVVGSKGSGKHTAVRRYLSRRADHFGVPSDWVYVHDFDHPFRPRALELKPGEGPKLARRMDKLVEDLRSTATTVFEGDEHRLQKEAIDRRHQESSDVLVKKVAEEAATRGLMLVRTQQGLAVVPAGPDKQAMPPADFQKLPEDERKRLQGLIQEVQQMLQDASRQTPRIERERQKAVRELVQSTAELLVEDLVREVGEGLAKSADLAAWLADVRADLISHIELFVRHDAPAGPVPGPETGPDPMRRYAVNVLVSHGEEGGAPVVMEDHPTLGRLVGRVEFRVQQGAMVTDLTLIRPGALHRANGGYLLINGQRLLREPHAWDALKRALYNQEVTIEAPSDQAATALAVTIQPASIPLNIKIVLFGGYRLYLALSALDPDFGDLFKVMADFDDVMDRDAEHDGLYARLIATVQRRENLRPFDRAAVERVIERCSRAVADSERLTARVGLIADIMREADYVGRDRKHTVIRAGDVEEALAAQERRSDRVKRRSQEMIERETILVDTEGEAVGQINGLSVLSIGASSFGKPTRITARVRMGTGKVIDIEREVELGGPLHSKGMLILQGYLAGQFCPDVPIALQASLVFEQSYGGVDGDSASSTELYALLSALSDLPIRQGLAVTGSVNQMGAVQAIGGVNEKIEGFFELCAARGLTGEQGVLIPAANVPHLMLKRPVIEACEKGRFRIWAVSTVAEGIEILTGVPAGDRGADGRFPEGTVNAAVEARLLDFAEKRRAFAKGDGESVAGDDVG